MTRRDRPEHDPSARLASVRASARMRREPEVVAEPAGPDPVQVLMGPGALVTFALAAVVAVFPLGFLTDDPQWWAVMPPGAATVSIAVALVWAVSLRRRGAVPLSAGRWWAVVGVMVALLVFAALTAARMHWQSAG